MLNGNIENLIWPFITENVVWVSGLCNIIGCNIIGCNFTCEDVTWLVDSLSYEEKKVVENVVGLGLVLPTITLKNQTSSVAMTT